MKKLLLAASIATMFSGAAFGSVNLDTGTDAGSTGTYAAEATINATLGDVQKVGLAADQVATATLGATFATDFVAYVRFDLSSGTFEANPTFAVKDSNGNGAIVNVAQGGAGEDYVIFAVAPAPDPLGSNLVNGEVGTFTGAGIRVLNKDTVNLTYRLYETLTNAANEVLHLKSRTATFTSFANAISITPGDAQLQTADVSEITGAYKKFVGASLEEPVASFTVKHTTRALLNGAASTAGDILADTNDVAINGDFTFVSQLAVMGVFPSVTLNQDETCAGAGVSATTLNNTKATFANLSAAAITAAEWFVCVNANGTTAIPIASYSGSIDLDAQTNFTVADGATGTGNIVRNGTVLKAAFAETTGVAGMSSAVHLTNTSAADAKYIVSCVLNSGAIAGNPGTIPANTAVRYSLSSTLGCPTDGTLRGLELTFEVPTGSVIGSIVRQNVSTGTASFDGMIGNK